MVKILFAAQATAQKSTVVSWVLPLSVAAALLFVAILLAGAYLIVVALKQRRQQDSDL